LTLQWHYSQESFDWNVLSDLYKVAPLGEKRPEEFQKAFTNSCGLCIQVSGIFIYDDKKMER
jgi:hypothetical protein